MNSLKDTWGKHTLLLQQDLLSDQISLPPAVSCSAIDVRPVARWIQVWSSFGHVCERLPELLGGYPLDFVEDRSGNLEDRSGQA